MNINHAPHAGPVALVGLTTPDLDHARDATILAGAHVCSDPAQASLILAAPDAPVPDGIPCVRIGGQIKLPADTALLVSLIAEASRGTRRSGPVWIVAGIAGGVGVTSLVRLLARAGRSGPRGFRRVSKDAHPEEHATRRRHRQSPVVLDASGSVPGFARARDHDRAGVRWADLEQAEDSYLPALLTHLPIIGATPALVGDSRGGASADDPRVAAACRSLDPPIIVDAGRWDTRAHRCARAIKADALILVSRGDIEGAAAMSASLASTPPPCPALTVVAASTQHKATLKHCAPPPILRAPTRPGRDLRTLLRALATLTATPPTPAASHAHTRLTTEAPRA